MVKKAMFRVQHGIFDDVIGHFSACLLPRLRYIDVYLSCAIMHESDLESKTPMIRSINF